jgi:4,5-DOPA dioxygenase extradiol
MERKKFIQTVLGLTAMANLSVLQQLSDTLREEDEKYPVLFVGHGSPMNAIKDNEFTERWKAMAKEITRPKAVLCISAHWLTQGTKVTAMDAPKTIHDFGGFPKELFAVEYSAPGNATLAKETKEMIKSTTTTLDHDWGLDHGTWSVVKQMYPDADIPVLQLSIDYSRDAQYHYNLGKELAALRKKGVLIIGSGNMVHNLGMLGFPKDVKPQDRDFNAEYGYDWALEMKDIFRKKIEDKDHKSLIDYKNLSKSAILAIPTPDHYYPLMYALALQDEKETVSFFNDKAVAGAITMTSLKIG